MIPWSCLFVRLVETCPTSSQIKQGDHHSHAQFFEAYSEKLNVSVVAIRGTDVGRISDLIEDIKVSRPVRPSRNVCRGGGWGGRGSGFNFFSGKTMFYAA